MLNITIDIYEPKVIGMMWSMLAQEQTWFGSEPWKSYGIQVFLVISVFIIVLSYYQSLLRLNKETPSYGLRKCFQSSLNLVFLVPVSYHYYNCLRV